MTTEARFYTIANEPFYPGVAALLNSLRLTGHDHELVILDVGLTESQRNALAEHSTIIQLPHEATRRPEILKPYPALLDVEGVVVLIDSDMIVTDSLEPIVALAATGKICAWSEVPWGRDRWFAEWEELFSLAAPPRRQPYVNAGFVALSTEHWPGFLGRWWHACEAVPSDRHFEGDLPDPLQKPLYCGDQDALNAILMSEVSPDGLELLLLPNADRKDPVVVEDESTLVCTYGGQRQSILHEVLRPKIWLPESWQRVRANAYTQLMPRVLFSPDVAVRLDPADVPLWLRPGLRSKLVRHGLSAVTRVREKGRLAPGRAARETRRALEWARTTLPLQT